MITGITIKEYSNGRMKMFVGRRKKEKEKTICF
uniref:Uncharacterized protein n=1 Tax=Tetranychus urticae TaxID=32264 RepID=T1JZB9_TETUR